MYTLDIYTTWLGFKVSFEILYLAVFGAKIQSFLCEQPLHFELQRLIKNAKNGLFWRVFENLKLAVKQCYQTGQF